MLGKHFVHPGAENVGRHSIWLPPRLYSKIQDTLPIVCADAILIDPEGKMIVGVRQIDPWPGPWMIGGRMRVGESPLAAVQRNIQRELGLRIAQRRFMPLSVYSFLWPTRAQKPKNHGVHHISIAYTLQISQREKNRIKNNEEYVRILWRDPLDVARRKDSPKALKFMAREVNKRILLSLAS